MASVQDFIQNSQTRTVQHNHVIIQYQQPPDPAIINHALEILVSVTRNYAHKNVVQILDRSRLTSEDKTLTRHSRLFKPNSSVFTNSI